MTTSQTATRSFVDLRVWAAGATVAAGEGDSFLSARAVLPQPEGPVSIGLIALPQGSGSVVAMSADEFIIVESGSVQIDQRTLNEGDGIVLCEGATFDWTTTTDARLLFVRRTGGSVADGNFTDYRSADGEFVCGTWDSTPYHRRSMAYRHYELMYLLDGIVTFVDGAGAEGTFGKGDIFLVEQGASCSWDSQVHVKKIYAIYRPA
jgi:uncharacterized cupin superfamily protein